MPQLVQEVLQRLAFAVAMCRLCRQILCSMTHAVRQTQWALPTQRCCNRQQGAVQAGCQAQGSLN